MKRKVVALMLVGVMVSSAGYAGTTVYAERYFVGCKRKSL